MINSIPPRPINPLFPLFINKPVIVIIIKDTANTSENHVHHRHRIIMQTIESTQYRTFFTDSYKALPVFISTSREETTFQKDFHLLIPEIIVLHINVCSSPTCSSKTRTSSFDTFSCFGKLPFNVISEREIR